MEVLELPKMDDVEVKELEVYRAESVSVLVEAQQVAASITDASSAEAAAQWCSLKLGFCERIKKSYLGRVRDYLYKGWQDSIAEIDKYVVPIEGKKGKDDTGGAVGVVRRAIVAWRAQESKRLAEANARLIAEARKKDEDERLAAAIKAEAAGHAPIANAILAQVGNFVAPVVEVQKSKTHSGRMVWKVRIDALKKGELLKMIADKPELYAFVSIDESKILKQARLMDGNLNWPGVSCYQEEELSIRKT